jgi:preprotein translocase subunit SecE
MYMMEVENVQSPSWPTRTKEYIGDVQAEMKRVTWPTWPQVRATTMVVIVTTFLFSAYFWVIDVAVNAAVQRVINFFTK